MKHLVIIIAVITALTYWLTRPPKNIKNYDVFAQCLASKNVTMYGAAWCPHCQNQKKLFGESFKYVPYIECPDNTKLCLDKGITGYPTWLASDSARLEGEQTLEKLAQISSCSLP